MNDLDIDETLPGQEIEEDIEKEVIRREADVSTSLKSSNFSFDESSFEAEKAESLRGWLYLVAGAGYGTLVVYLVLVIQQGMDIPLLGSDSGVSDTSGALSTAVLISAMVYVTIWFFMSGRNHSFFTEDPDKAKFYAGIIGLASLVIIAISWEAHQREMVISAILTAVSTWSYIRSSEMKV
ncbi:MAG: hypothetical protein BEU01_01335 [Marine Group III euryarchaeote CG-Epi4]|uniref:Uncharacterized protein n=1 Tax=Marine Group III euryarchaeote CG-Epi4 TaxID=1888998 RepID=A0A1J5TWL5_9ARCH|nr:MAG: hypothetical protein BEU01_01335 [Marine Group III euryarchaeote CG-Epi4]